jgi:hypothetical protein
MDLTIHASSLPHEDPEASLASGATPSASRSATTSATAGSAGSPSAPPGCGVTDQERRMIVETVAKGTYAAINLATADLDGVFERLQAGGAPGGPGNPPYPSRARRSVTATRSRTTRRPAERSSASRSDAPGHVVHRTWAVVERQHGARSQRGGGNQCRRDDDNTRTSQTPSNQRGQVE